MSLLIAELVCEATRKNDSGAVVRHTGADRVVIGLGSSEPFRYIGQFKPRYFGMLGWLNAWMGKMGQVAWEHHRESLEVAGLLSSDLPGTPDAGGLLRLATGGLSGRAVPPDHPGYHEPGALCA